MSDKYYEDYLEETGGRIQDVCLQCGEDLEYIEWLEKKLDQPRHETVEEWKLRTGEIYPDDGPVWYTVDKSIPECWHICEYWMVKKTDIEKNSIIVATHHGKPEESR